jgi:hypothetical protein
MKFMKTMKNRLLEKNPKNKIKQIMKKIYKILMLRKIKTTKLFLMNINILLIELINLLI